MISPDGEAFPALTERLNRALQRVGGHVAAYRGGLAHPPPASYHRTMRLLQTCLILPVLLFGLNGCAPVYDPPIAVDHASAKYKTDIKKCQTTSTETVRRQNADTPWTWMTSPFTGPPRVRAAIRICMEHDGYLVEKAGG